MGECDQPLEGGNLSFFPLASQIPKLTPGRGNNISKTRRIFTLSHYYLLLLLYFPVTRIIFYNILFIMYVWLTVQPGTTLGK